MMKRESEKTKRGVFTFIVVDNNNNSPKLFLGITNMKNNFEELVLVSNFSFYRPVYLHYNLLQVKG